MGDKYTDQAEKLVGQTVVGVDDVSKWDVVLEFESGAKLRVYDAKWRIEEADDAERGA